MTGFRASASFIAASFASALLMAPGCGTDAHGIDDCRSIEQARCSAAANCGDPQNPGVDRVVVDVDSCQRFYRDQCLHGSTTASPGAPAVNDCVRAIRAAGECATATPDNASELCPEGLTPENACSRILSPERLPDCNFLSPDPPVGEGGAPGATGGAPGATSGAGGQGETTATGGSSEGGSVATGGVSGG